MTLPIAMWTTIRTIRIWCGSTICHSIWGKNEERKRLSVPDSFAAAFRNLFTWVRIGAAPAHCDRIAIDSDGENKGMRSGNTIGGLRTCLLDYPTGRYSNTSDIEKARISWIRNRKRKDCSVISRRFQKRNDKRAVRNIGTLPGNGGENTKEQVTKGFVCREDAAELVEIAVQLAKKRGLE